MNLLIETKRHDPIILYSTKWKISHVWSNKNKTWNSQRKERKQATSLCEVVVVSKVLTTKKKMVQTGIIPLCNVLWISEPKPIAFREAWVPLHWWKAKGIMRTLCQLLSLVPDVKEVTVCLHRPTETDKKGTERRERQEKTTAAADQWWRQDQRIKDGL